jgi:hypothetical protein
MSFGFDEQNEAVVQAVAKAHSRHVLMFAAASNSGNRSDLPYPARYPKVFLVHCADGNGNKSIRNPQPVRLRDNFSILGQDVLSTWPSGRPRKTQFNAKDSVHGNVHQDPQLLLLSWLLSAR